MKLYTEESIGSSFVEESRSHVRRKILLLGAPGVGKSAIIMRFKDDIFLDYYEPTLHSKIRKKFTFNDQDIDLEIIDIDGQTEYTLFSFSKFSYGIDGYVFCYSVESRYSFDLIKLIHSKLFSMIGRKVPKILLANKIDLNNRIVGVDDGLNYAKEIICPYLECSAKNSYNITRVFKTILVEINKYESNVELKNLTCIKMLELIIKREKQFKFIIYFMMILHIVNINNSDSGYSRLLYCIHAWNRLLL
jgi:Ras family protein